MRIFKNNRGDNPNKFVSVSGEKIIPKYVGKMDKETGIIELVEVGKENWYEKIQSYKDMCDVNKIVQRYMNGEIDILNQVQGTYGDFAKAPKDLAEAVRMAHDAEETFNRLPVEVKQKFENNAYLWMKDSGSEDWFKKMGFVKEDKKDGIKENEKVGDGE